MYIFYVLTFYNLYLQKPLNSLLLLMINSPEITTFRRNRERIIIDNIIDNSFDLINGKLPQIYFLLIFQ